MTEATTNPQAFWCNLNYIICRSFASIFAYFRKYTHFLKAHNFFIVYRSTWKCSWRQKNSWKNSWRRKSRRRNDLFSRKSSLESCAPKRYWRGVKDLTIFHTENDQKIRNKTIETTGRVYFKGWKKDVPDENLFRQNNRKFVKLLESAALTWFGLTKPLIVKN